ncbi:MAG: Holliday junction branch migration protein RuvA [Pseudomonadota bacterium]
MIGRLKGTIEAINEDSCLIDVGGVGYEVLSHPRALDSLAVGAATILSIETIVREDFIRLYGFVDEAERKAFRLLQTVQGVGAKHALAILQVLKPADLYDAIAAEDLTALSRASGVGKKLAQRIAVELQSKLGDLATSVGGVSNGAKLRAVAKEMVGGDPDAEILPTLEADAISALVNLGYEAFDARKAARNAIKASAEPNDLSAVIKNALKELAA